MGSDPAPVYTSRPISEWAFDDLPLPPRLQEQICKRIRGMAVLTLATCAVSFTFAINASIPEKTRALQFVGIALVVIAASLMIGIVRRLRLRTAIQLALFIEFMICLFISSGNPSYELPTNKSLPGVTWIVPIIIMFPLFIPTPPIWTRWASVACVLTVPCGTTIAYYLDGQPKLDLASTLPFAMVSPTIAAIIACLGSSLVYEIGVYAEKIRRAGNFQIGKRIGAGGMGEVYEGKHNRLPMRAAIKYIKPVQLKKRLGGAEPAKKRFEREAEALAKLCSPHTVEIYDFNLDDDGKLFYVMELLEGWDLNTLVDYVGVVPPARVAYLLSQACGALAEAHDMGVIHRDVKPSNIMACHYGRDRDFVKVLDFGIMTMAHEEYDPLHSSWSELDPEFKEGLTQGTVVIGTPDYMSPEQAANKPLDARSDIYALGCVAYYLLTGKLVFPGGTDHEKMQRHKDEPPPRPSEHSTQRISPALDDLVVSCLAKLPEDRPQNADQLAAALLSSVSEPWSAGEILSWWSTNGLPKRDAPVSNSVSVSGDAPSVAEKKRAWHRLFNWV